MEVICASPWVPVEWIQAHGHEPRAVWLAPPVAVAAVPEAICAFAQSVRHLTDARPEAAVVFTTACDQLRRAADAALAGNRERVFLCNLPVTWQTPAARQLYHVEVARFGRFLTRLGGRAPSDVVLHAAEPGERTLLPALGAAAESDAPIRVLADHYFDRLADVFQRPNVRLYDWLRLRLAERRVRGLVLWAHVGCDLWRAEAASLREAFGLPLLLLEAHATRGVAPRDLNRLQAFLESLR